MSDSIEKLLKIKPYSQTNEEKKPLFMQSISESLQHHYNNCLDYQNYCKKKQFQPKEISDITKIPFLPINIFKKMILLSVPKSEIIRVVKSSSTTSNVPSTIHLDKKTANQQIIALNSIMRNFLGEDKLDFIIMDNKKTIELSNLDLSSRGSAIRGFLIFARRFNFILNENLDLDVETLNQINSHDHTNKCIFGFTWLIYKIISKYKNDETLKNLFSTFEKPIILHIGGWKKLTELSIDKNQFNEEASRFFNTTPDRIIDVYGMTEQLGIVYPDCEKGYKHVPVFSEILIRDPLNLDIQPDGKDGFIQVLSPIPHSYPGVSLLTDDIGEIIGRDNCSCGRKGTYFIFKKRSEIAEPKGCGDTIEI